MKTVSTKLDNKVHNRFIEICNEDGKCQSEFLRDLIETVCEDLEEEPNDEPLEINYEDVKIENKSSAEGIIKKSFNIT